MSSASPWDHYDPRDWPTTAFPTSCEACGRPFTDPIRQIFLDSVYSRSDSGLPVILRDAPAGACWDAYWIRHDSDGRRTGPDGVSLVVRCPGGHDWMTDGPASNCDQPGRPHKCWVRHGDPRKCDLTVDKGSPGESCNAGAGSIITPQWHGFLTAGVLQEHS